MSEYALHNAKERITFHMTMIQKSRKYFIETWKTRRKTSTSREKQKKCANTEHENDEKEELQQQANVIEYDPLSETGFPAFLCCLELS